MNIDKIWSNYVHREADRCANSLTRRPKIRLDKTACAPISYRPWGLGLICCIHDKFYIETCLPCKRTAKDAKKNLDDLLSRDK